MLELPPLSVIHRLPIVTLIKLARTVIKVVIQRNCLEHVLAELIEEMDIEDVFRIKPQLDRSEGILKRIIETRVKWDDWPTSPVAWECKDYADGWIRFDNQKEALDYQLNSGCIMRPIWPTTGVVTDGG